MARFLAVFILLGFISMVFCGFVVVNHGMGQHAAHTAESGFAEHHFGMWSDFSTAIVSDIASYIGFLALVLLSIVFAARTFGLILSSELAVPLPPFIPIDERKWNGTAFTLRSWLTRFELSPSFA